MLELLAIIKGMAWFSGGVATFHLFSNLNIKGFKKLIKLKAIDFSDKEHVTFLGITRHGKTYALIKSLEKHIGAVFFYNVNDETVKGFIRADSSSSPKQIINALKNKKKINFIPSGDLEKDSKILGAFITHLFENNIHIDCKFAIDEVHLFNDTKCKDGIKACKRIATTGLRRGYQGIWITQRGAMIDNTLFTQSTRIISFALGNNDYQYLKNQGVPIEEFIARTNQEKYKFVDYDLKEVKGAFMIV